MKYFHENRYYKDDFKLSCITGRNFAFQAHYHNDIEIFLVTKGTAVIGINTETIELREGDAAYIAGGDIHYYSATPDGCDSLMLIISSDLLDFEIKNELESVIVRKGVIADIKSLMQAVFRENTDKKNGYELFCKNYIGLIASGILREKERLLPVDKPAGHRISMKRFRNVLEYIDNNCENPITLEEISELMHYSRWYFSKIFKRLTGTSFIKYINQQRIDRAKQMIKETDMNITNISVACGFESIRTFNREFKAICKKTPKEYREEHIIDV